MSAGSNAREEAEVVVVGGGAAGLGVAGQLSRRGIDSLVLDRNGVLGESWRSRYDSLVLNTVRALSSQPGFPIPRSAGRWVRRDEFAGYLQRYAERHRLDVRLGVRAERIERAQDRWRVRCRDRELLARHVVVATGYDAVPKLPDWPGCDSFHGRLIHSAKYRSSTPFRGREVLVVGAGNSGTEIATQLAEDGAARVRLSMRTPINLIPAELLGLPATFIARLAELQPAWLVDRMGFALQRAAFGDLTRWGVPRAPVGVATELRTRGLGPVLERGFVRTLKAGDIEIVAAVGRLDGDRVVLADGSALRPEVLIAATGYRQGLERLVGALGILLPSGKPAVNGEQTHAAAPRLYFNGFWLPLSGQLPAMRRSSRRIARAVARDRK